MKPKNRKEKIQFLKGVLKGENKVSDLIPKTLEFYIHDCSNPGKYYKTGQKEKYFTTEQLHEYKKENPFKEVIVINRVLTPPRR